MMNVTKLFMAAKAAATLAAGGEAIECEAAHLEDYGFKQFSTNDEYVCVNETDYTDFIIIEDEEKTIHAGDNMAITLNKYGEVITKVKKD